MRRSRFFGHFLQGRFREAEDAFLKAHKPREAVDMYVHAQAQGRPKGVC